jgi:hypothetical protein
MTTPRQRCLERLTALRALRSPWDVKYREIADYMLPWRFRASPLDTRRPDNSKILDPTATLALRTCAAGMASGICSPARQWFRLTTPDPKTASSDRIKGYLWEAQQILEWILQRSGFYGVTSGAAFYDLASFGTFGMFIDEHQRHVASFKPLAVGSYWVAADNNGSIDTVYREFPMTIAQMVGEFGIDAVSPGVREQFKRGQLDSSQVIVHLVEPNRPDQETGMEGMRSGMMDWRGKAFRSVWMEQSNPADAACGFLRCAGYEEFPAVVPRWARTQPEDAYGTGPGHEVLPDVKQLQLMQRRLLQMIEKQAIPPLKGPDSLIGGVPSQLPGAFTKVPSGAGPGDRLEPIYVPDHGAVQQVRAQINELRSAIREGLFADLWRVITDDERAQRATAEEIRAKREERLLQLGPVVNAIEDEYLRAIIDRVWAIADRMHLLPEPPEELHGTEMKVEFLSIMSEAQKAQQIPGVERTASFVLSLSQINPDALDVIDVDKMAERYADITGLPPDLLRPDDERKALRDARTRQAQAQQQGAAMATAAKGAQDLSGASLENDNALSRIIGTMGPAAAAQAGSSLQAPYGGAQ